uniref:Uncharacterized protein n=1 Tax=Panagrolaimus sp. ES5 TaxID=591445 RepID=A0AC34FIB0_9BILA
MDTSASKEASSSSSQDSGAGEEATISPVKKASFLSSYRIQSFSLPDSIMFYMAKNPPSAEIYQKLIQSCKYFFVKNPLLVVSELHLGYRNGWHTCGDEEKIDLKNIPHKLWISRNLNVVVNCGIVHIDACNGQDRFFVSSLISKFYRCDVTKLTLQRQTISFKDFIFLASNVESLQLTNALNILNEDGSVATLEKIVEALPKLTYFEFCFDTDVPEVVTPKTIHNLLKIPHFSNLTRLGMSNVPQLMDIDALYAFVKKNKKTKLSLSFLTISEGYRNHLQAIVDDVIQSGNRDFIPPYFDFPDMDQFAYDKLCELTI